MGNKVFISYKFDDGQVKDLPDVGDAIVRDYVDILVERLEKLGYISKAEDTDEDLSDYSEEYIESVLYDLIWDSSVTILLISPGMKESGKREKQQWIPWEVSYSLRNVRKGGRVSHRNAMLAVVLPDENGKYDYAIAKRNCTNSCSCNVWQTGTFFRIIADNMFNLEERAQHQVSCTEGSAVYKGACSYIDLIRWSDFLRNIKWYIDAALVRKDRIDAYKIAVNLTDD